MWGKGRGRGGGGEKVSHAMKKIINSLRICQFHSKLPTFPKKPKTKEEHLKTNRTEQLFLMQMLIYLEAFYFILFFGTVSL